MNKESICIKTNSNLKEITFEENGNSWYLAFDNNVAFTIHTMWRLFESGEPILISNDHRHQFGLPNPLDLVAELKNKFVNKILKEIQIEKNTGDLILSFANDVKLIAYISSMGYESYEVFAIGNQYVAQGGGNITIFQLK